MPRFFHFAMLVLLAVAPAVGCTRSLRPQLGAIYNRAAMSHGPDVTPVIVIPGILGSRLVDDDSGVVVWGAFSGDYANAEKPQGARLAALPMAEGVDLADLRDEVRPDGALERVRFSLLGLPVSLEAYGSILATLGVGGYRDPSVPSMAMGRLDYGADHFTCFQFDYDWRRDNVENARLLGAHIRARQADVSAELKKNYGVDRAPESIKFDIVAHSMGGLIAHYYLRYGEADLPSDGSAPEVTWAGAANISQLIMIGTPNAGSVAALEDLVTGKQFAFFLPEAPAHVLGTMPSIYQLLPRSRHGRVVEASGKPVSDLYDPKVWIANGWGLAGGDDRTLRWLLPNEASAAERRRVALDHLKKCLRRAQQFHAALDHPAAPPAEKGVTISLFAGDAVQTNDVLIAKRRGRLGVKSKSYGDGYVTRSSAVMDERLDGRWTPRLRTPIAWNQVTFLFDDHLGLTRSQEFSDNLLYRLMESPLPSTASE